MQDLPENDEEVLAELIAEEEDPEERERMAERMRELHTRKQASDGSGSTE